LPRESVRRFKAIERQAIRKLDMLDAAPDLGTLATLPGNRLEALKGNRKGQHSIRVNDQWRICFVWREVHAFRASQPGSVSCACARKATCEALIGAHARGATEP